MLKLALMFSSRVAFLLEQDEMRWRREAEAGVGGGHFALLQALEVQEAADCEGVLGAVDVGDGGGGGVHAQRELRGGQAGGAAAGLLHLSNVLHGHPVKAPLIFRETRSGDGRDGE